MNISQLFHQYAAEGRLPVPARNLEAPEASRRIQDECQDFVKLTGADDGPEDGYPGPGLVRSFYSGGGMDLPAVTVSSYAGDCQQGSRRDQR